MLIEIRIKSIDVGYDKYQSTVFVEKVFSILKNRVHMVSTFYGENVIVK